MSKLMLGYHFNTCACLANDLEIIVIQEQQKQIMKKNKDKVASYIY